MLLLVVICLIFIILTFIWYLIVRNVSVEQFHDNFNSRKQYIIKFGKKYLQGEKGKRLKLGNNQSLSVFQTIDHPDGIQLESAEYPGYLIGFEGNNWSLLSKYYLPSIDKTVFIPFGIKKNKNTYALVNISNKYCLTLGHKNKIVSEKFNKIPTSKQLLTLEKI